MRDAVGVRGSTSTVPAIHGTSSRHLVLFQFGWYVVGEHAVQIVFEDGVAGVETYEPGAQPAANEHSNAAPTSLKVPAGHSRFTPDTQYEPTGHCVCVYAFARYQPLVQGLHATCFGSSCERQPPRQNG